MEAVCFDVDSTVCVDEGIDELAEFCGAGKAVAEWTARFVVHLNANTYYRLYEFTRFSYL